MKDKKDNDRYTYDKYEHIYCSRYSLDSFEDYYHVADGLNTVFDWHGNGLFTCESEDEAIDLCKTLNNFVDTVHDQREQVEFLRNKVSNYEKINLMIHDLLKVIDGLVVK